MLDGVAPLKQAERMKSSETRKRKFYEVYSYKYQKYIKAISGIRDYKEKRAQCKYGTGSTETSIYMPGSQVYQTRSLSRGDISSNLRGRALLQKSFFQEAIRAWNLLPNDIRSIHKLTDFKLRLVLQYIPSFRLPLMHDRRLEHHTGCRDLFTRKQKELDTIREERFILRNRLRLYHIALKTIESYMENNQNGILEDAIMKALFESSSSFKTENDDDEGGEYESGAYDKEAGILLDYIENFTELIENGSYKEASYIAACSPKGVLRNMETLLRFKNIVKPDDEDITPWLFHCKVLADTALEALFKPDIVISLECAKAALDEKHVDMLYRWCAENRLTYSYELGKLIEQMAAPPTSIELAEFVYRKVNAHFEVACCLLQTGSSKRCIDYLEDVGESSNEQILKLFNLYPSVKFAVDMMNMKSNMFNAEELVLLFIQTDKHWNAIKFLQALIEQQKHIIQTETNKENHTKNEEYLVKLKKSFEMLKKWSYLADDNESKSNEIGEDKKEMESQTQTQIPLKHSLSQSSSFDDACFEDDDDNEYEFLNDEEYDSIQTTLNEKEFAHHLTRRITKSALAHFKKRVLITNATLLEAIEEHDEDATTLSTPRGSCKLQRQTDPNGVNGMKTQRTEEEAYFSENEYDEHNSNNSLQTIHNDFFNDFPGLYLTDDVLHTDSN
ncbi:unnamed protein product [Didymodactylos carnosus]|uniref:Uncharacterized protein n=1 Tax=Didymodactylos carnosus TaxID=1234261 RepID=A0A8S2EE06_9BILA|nr:unnamed protein product [Didymodactylos carnosus]CAF3895925.1 unnamed protein product [Didymodactylos carnosus]